MKTLWNKLAEFVKSHMKTVIIATLSLLVLTAVILAVCFIKPREKEHFIDETLDSLFFDGDALIKMAERLDNKGFKSDFSMTAPIELTQLQSDLTVTVDTLGYSYGKNVKGKADYTIGVGKSEHSFGLGFDRKGVYLYGKNKSGEDVDLFVPTDDLKENIDSSIFSPESESKFALNPKTYDAIVKAFEESEDTIDEEFYEFIRNVDERISPLVDEQVEKRFVKGTLRRETVTSGSLDSEDVKAVFDIIGEELTEHEELLDSLSLGTDQINSLIKSLKESLGSSSMEYSYSVSRNKLTNFHLIITSKNINNTETLDVNLDVETKAKRSAFTLTIVGETGPSFDRKTDSLTIEYEKIKKGKNTDIVVDFINSEDGKEEEKSRLAFEYNMRKGDYRIAYSALEEMEYKESFSLEGKLKIKNNYNGFSFTLDKYTLDGKEYLDLINWEMKKSAKGRWLRLDKAQNMFDMSEEEINNLIYSLPYDKISDSVKSIFGVDLEKSEENLPIFDLTISTKKELLKQIYGLYDSNCTYYSLPRTYKIYVYFEESGVYALLDGEINYKVKLYYHPGDLLDKYHKAEIIGTELVVHDYQVTNETFADCHNAGYITRKCTICGVEYTKKTEDRQSHHTEDVTFEFTYDVGKTNDVVFSYCTKCNEPQTLWLDDYLYISFSEDGGVNSTYGTVKHIIIPNEIFDLCDMTGLNITYSTSLKPDFLSVRIPDGREVIEKDAFTAANNLQVIALPGSIKEIQDGAFYAEAPIRTIFYVGTEEEWKNVKLNGYASEWADVEIVFMPNGVDNLTIMEECIDKTQTHYQLKDKKALTESIDAAKELAENSENISLIYDGVVSFAAYDALTDTISVAEVKESITVIRFFTSEGQLWSTFELPDVITIMDSDGGLLALGSANNNSIYLYDIESGSCSSYVFEEYDCTFDELFVDEDRVVFVADCKTNTGEDMYILFPNGDFKRIEHGAGTYRFTFIREYHKIVGIDWFNSQICVCDTVGGVVTNRIYLTSVKSNKYMTDGYLYVSYRDYLSGDYSYAYYDFEMKKCETRPDSVWTDIPLDNDTLEIGQLITSTKGRAATVLHLDGEIGIAICGANGYTATFIDYYAESGWFTRDGDAILYTPGGYGIILVNT